MRLTLGQRRLVQIMAFVATLVIAILARSRDAHAYPQFQLALGTDRCVTCHVSPAGGGLLTAYGRDEAATTLSDGGDGRFLHGLWESPSWLQLGGDLRGAALVKRNTDATEVVAFPMQADVYVRAGGEHLSFNLTLGLRGGARDPQPPLLERIGSREHYLMYQADSGSYIRAGRFFPVFGIRSQDHTSFVRRNLGFHTLEEPYGVAAGIFGESWEGHLSAFVPRPIELLGAGVRGSGVAAYVERRGLDDTAALALQARYIAGPEDQRATLGLVGKRFFPESEVLLLAEVDLQRQSFADDGGPTRYQVAAYAGASKFVASRFLAGVAVQHWQPDVRVRSARDAVELNLQYFPRAHFEVHLLTRLTGAGDFESPDLLSLLQVHYYL